MPPHVENMAFMAISTFLVIGIAFFGLLCARMEYSFHQELASVVSETINIHHNATLANRTIQDVELSQLPVDIASSNLQALHVLANTAGESRCAKALEDMITKSHAFNDEKATMVQKTSGVAYAGAILANEREDLARTHGAMLLRDPPPLALNDESPSWRRTHSQGRTYGIRPVSSPPHTMSWAVTGRTRSRRWSSCESAWRK